MNMLFPIYNQCERLKLKFKSKDNPEVIRAKTIQITIGLIAIIWPIVLMIGHMIFNNQITFQDSISHYFYSEMAHVFTGGLFVIGASMLSYKGFHNIDGIMGNIAGFFAILVALFPTDKEPSAGLFSGSWPSIIHYVAAFLLFVALAYFCIVIFSLGHDEKVNGRYRTCGWLIIMCIVGMIMDILVFKDHGTVKGSGQFSLFLLLEIVALFSFGVSWLIKGNLWGKMRDSGVPQGYKEQLLVEYTNKCKDKPCYENLTFDGRERLT